MKKKGGVESLLPIISFLVIIGLWCILTYGKFIGKLFLPTPSSILKATIDMYNDGTLLTDIGMSVYRILVGWAISVVAAVPIGMLIASSSKASGLLRPIIEFARYLPVAALVPLTLIYCGLGENQKFVVIFLGTFFQLVLMVSDTVSSVDKNLLNAAKTLGASKFQRYVKVLFPASMPGLMDSFRMTIGWAWTYLVVAEMVAADTGLGYLIIKSQRFMATDRIFAGLILIGLIGLITDWVFKLVAKVIVPWQERIGE